MGQLEQKGWEIIKSKNLDELKILRNNIFQSIKKTFNIKENDPEKGINLLHEHCKNLSEGEFNEKNLLLISEISKNNSLVDTIFNSFDAKIKDLIGNDILVQKLINVKIQTPFNTEQTIPHRDAPPNSFFEIVVWIPLVNCQNTKSMYIFDLEETKNVLKQQEKNPSSWNDFIKNHKKNYVNIKFGESLFFLPHLYHGSDINKTEETRISLNIRFKNLFSPSSKKFPLHFFRPYKISEITKIGLQKTKEEYLK